MKSGGPESNSIHKKITGAADRTERYLGCKQKLRIAVNDKLESNPVRSLESWNGAT